MMESRLTPEEVRANLREVWERLAEAARASGREPEAVQLMAVTKTVPPELVNVAWEEGVRLFGENRAQELLEKAASYAFGPECIHFIGTLQTNKVRQILDKVSCVQSVNSLRLAQEALWGLLEEMAGFSALRVRGLMCIPPRSKTSLETERYFERMYKIFVDIKGKKIDNISMETLSMGMTGDYQLAARHGASLVRIGTGIFGKRG